MTATYVYKLDVRTSGPGEEDGSPVMMDGDGDSSIAWLRMTEVVPGGTCDESTGKKSGTLVKTVVTIPDCGIDTSTGVPIMVYSCELITPSAPRVDITVV